MRYLQLGLVGVCAVCGALVLYLGVMRGGRSGHDIPSTSGRDGAPAAPVLAPDNADRTHYALTQDERDRLSARARALMSGLRWRDDLAQWLVNQQGADGLWRPGEDSTAIGDDGVVAATALVMDALQAVRGRHRDAVFKAAGALAMLAGRRQDGSVCDDQVANGLAAYPLGYLTGPGFRSETEWHRARVTYVRLIGYGLGSQHSSGSWSSRSEDDRESVLATICWLLAMRCVGPATGRRNELTEGGAVGDLTKWAPTSDDLARSMAGSCSWLQGACAAGRVDMVMQAVLKAYVGGVTTRQEEVEALVHSCVRCKVLPAKAGSFALAVLSQKLAYSAISEQHDDVLDVSAMICRDIASQVADDGAWCGDARIAGERCLWGRTGEAALALYAHNHCFKALKACEEQAGLNRLFKGATEVGEKESGER